MRFTTPTARYVQVSFTSRNRDPLAPSLLSHPKQFQALPSFLDEYPNVSFGLQKSYYAMVSTVDSSVKNITDALKTAGLWNNTLLVWATDNGACAYVL